MEYPVVLMIILQYYTLLQASFSTRADLPYVHYVSATLQHLLTRRHQSFPRSVFNVSYPVQDCNGCFTLNMQSIIHFRAKMTPKTDSETTARVLAFHQLHLSTHRIVKKLSDVRISISRFDFEVYMGSRCKWKKQAIGQIGVNIRRSRVKNVLTTKYSP